MRRFIVSISDIDRNHFDTIELRIAQHPSETLSFLATRVLIYVLHHQDQISLSKSGLGDPSEPPLFVRQLTGDMVHWFDIGCPSLDRLNKATKTADCVTIYAYRALDRLLDTVNKLDYQRQKKVSCFELEPSVLSQLGESLTRTNEWSVVRTDDTIYVDSNGDDFQLTMKRLERQDD